MWGGEGQWQREELREQREFIFNLETPRPKGPYIWTQSAELRLGVGEGNNLQILGPFFHHQNLCLDQREDKNKTGNPL